MSEQPVSLRYEGDGQFGPVSGYWASQCDRHFVVGDTYRMTEHYERSAASHSHFFAALNDAYDSIPDEMRDEYPTVEHLRKKALIKKGYADERSIVCASKAEAQRLAAFMKPMDDYAIIVPSEAVVRVWTAKSQSKKAMGAKAFQESKQAVLDFVDDLLGVARGETARAAGYQHEPSAPSPSRADEAAAGGAPLPSPAAAPIPLSQERGTEGSATAPETAVEAGHPVQSALPSSYAAAKARR